jgi:hypothetical protein
MPNTQPSGKLPSIQPTGISNTSLNGTSPKDSNTKEEISTTKNWLDMSIKEVLKEIVVLRVLRSQKLWIVILALLAVVNPTLAYSFAMLHNNASDTIDPPISFLTGIQFSSGCQYRSNNMSTCFATNGMTFSLTNTPANHSWGDAMNYISDHFNKQSFSLVVSGKRDGNNTIYPYPVILCLHAEHANFSNPVGCDKYPS